MPHGVLRVHLFGFRYYIAPLFGAALLFPGRVPHLARPPPNPSSGGLARARGA